MKFYSTLALAATALMALAAPGFRSGSYRSEPASCDGHVFISRTRRESCAVIRANSEQYCRGWNFPYPFSRIRDSERYDRANGRTYPLLVER